MTEDGAPLQQTVDPEHSSTTKEPTCEAISAEDVCALREEVASLRVQLEELIAAQKGDHEASKVESVLDCCHHISIGR